MRCQHCHQNEATIRLNMQINSVHKQMVLCETCYHELTRKPSMSMGPQSFGFPFEQAFQPKEQGAAKASEKKGLLDELAQNITNGAKAGLIDPVIGRDEEVARVIEILNRRNKNNPVLIGEPGVGKTAIAEGLALKIADGDVPHKLKNKELYLLDVASLVANTGIRGQFEERMKQLITELKERKNVILFIDEIHLLVGAGSAEGSMDAGNILKPALARGELQVIGATTLKEYRQIEKDAALERRFQPVMVQEPTIEQAISILQGIKDKYEAYHGVTFSNEALKACVTLSARYIQDRHLPDKAIDLLDEAGSKANLLINDLNDEDAAERLTAIEAEKTKALEEENYELAAKLRDEEIALEKKLNSSSSHSAVTVEAEHIQDIVEQKTGIPVGKLQGDEQTKMKELEAKLHERVIGQEAAVQKVAKAVRRSRAGLKSKNRPVGSFLFVGPTGVGKTELSKTLADELFGTKDAIIRLDMSEYMEKHAVSKIIGSPPGYIGHEEAGQLTEKVRRNPYSIVLLDEIEKAHPDVQHMFLQIMEDGRLTDSQGRTVSFKDTVIIMTSNAGTGEKQTKVGFQSEDSVIEEQTLINSLSMFFKPEFLNRFDSIIEFRSLEKEHLVKIVSLLLGELKETLAERSISLSFSDEAKEKIAELGYHPSFGARPLRRTIQELIEDEMTDLLLDNNEIASFHVTVEDDNIKVHAK
ncbi:ATP-dependent protease ATP-binding subunit ClpE [Bacillus mojavensis]|uniref:ATP-dependent protease ATP-binding subunit ClpE n=1 Tax=Bacillus mojavensis TaxID=72360 RepID=UPI002DB6BF6E|nr:ATP-dependent protease ATP-binding subunit ClpE [Bacillus mojavensis]MEC1615415.1 ATP-dependent protease ATP-binding subunit ClpE [Bacillus mojavensis]MEC1621024.1 ATP-dependent protease ATP-binding subunit ClpE [Bacillus mojavensis]MEC1659031.1 ATP-dependent protease ATP-binding subunit ClpE [Bacillus mojavensis]MEC1690288.1 ATP-dependent protease ATP-binding subunit ClpE [Bacillus mojavensis]MEC1734611.1 ATP-dependent protease ATP-binding subunit ClpE [Bacillus mojavensis]